MACGITIGEVHGELTDVEARLAGEFADACTHEASHGGDHRYPRPQRLRPNIALRTQSEMLSIWLPA